MRSTVLKPDKTTVVLFLSFISFFVVYAITAGITEFLIFGEIHDLEENAAIEIIYLITLLMTFYLQAVFAKWYINS